VAPFIRPVRVLPAAILPWSVALAAAIGCAVVAAADPTHPGSGLPGCPFKALTGWDCPGCGSSRMLYSLLHGDLAAAARYNALALVAVPFLLWRWLLWVRAARGGRSVVPVRLPGVVWSALPFVVGAWWLVRNLPFAPFTGLRV